MRSLGKELRDHHQTIVQRWYERWRESAHPSTEVDEAALKNDLPEQLRLIGDQLCDLRRAESAARMWHVTDRLDPEARVDQEIPIEELIQEYALVTDVVRDWIDESGIEVPFAEYSYFHQAIFELAAESARRYSGHQADRVRQDRAHYLASVMHQLRTPLMAISMQVDLIEKRGVARDGSTIEKLRRNLHRITALVDAILRLERFATSEVPVRSDWVFPARLIEEMLDNHGPVASSKGLRLEAKVDHSLRMRIDPDLFTDALGNLIQNAVKYTSEGSVIVDAEDETEEVHFCVKDSGPGIPDEQVQSLFKETQPGSASGSGIGLQIARHAAEAQGGRIAVRSQLGKGSVFSLCLPRIVDRETERGDP